MTMILNIFVCLLPLTTSVKITYNSLPYTHPTYNSNLPWHVCPTFPNCALDTSTGLWYSDPAASLYRNSNEYEATHDLLRSSFVRDSDETFTKCMFDNEYCSPIDAIKKYAPDDVDSPSACQQLCEANNDCKFWTFLQLRGKHICSLLSECSAKSKCPSKSSCASGPKKCTCPALDRTSGSEEDSKYARWNCGDTSYDEELEVGTKCTATCGNWRNAENEIIVVESECQLGGDWSTTKALTGQTLAYDNYYHWAKPNEDDMKCGCDTITVREYDPNTEDGALFVCAESKDFSTEWTMTTSDQCVLYCNEDLAASFACAADGWTGQPENGFWCYTNPGIEVQIGNEK
eukprot:TRINITY_DN7703_c1_g1_i5.p1 TRINITY_DN7703_c1_g1~~TRINITY_DN7703_c1_g1_i5.p1  ORF type:complete len:346 (-),score=54.61 TRINITY_DN7703_c1_g1_i5:102-1139(-)